MCRSPSGDLQVEAAVFGEQVEHVIEEADARVVVVATVAVEVEPDGDVGFFRLTMDVSRTRFEFGGSHGRIPFP